MVIELKQISKKYGDNHAVLNDITFDIKAGTTLAITGPSGSGKSTLLNLMGTLDFPTSGTITIDGKSTADFNRNELVDLRNKRIGFVFQSHLLLPQLTVLENILLPVIPRDRDFQKRSPDRAMKLLDIVGLKGKANSFPGEMSVGECQRVAVIRSLINEPEIVLADEPTGSLDHDSADTLSEMLLKLRGIQGFSLVVVTHSPDLARRMATTCRLINGKIVAD